MQPRSGQAAANEWIDKRVDLINRQLYKVHSNEEITDRKENFKAEYESSQAYYDNSETFKDGSELTAAHNTEEIKKAAIDEQANAVMAEESTPENTQETTNEEATFEVDTQNAEMRKKIEGIRKSIIDMQIGSSDYVDLTNDFAWMDTDIVSTLTSGSSATKNAIPSVYAIEYEQTISSVLTNIINNINIGINGLGNIMGSFDTLVNKLAGDSGSSSTSSTEGTTITKPEGDSSIFGKLAKFGKQHMSMENITDDMVLLAPYQYLYATKKTGKRFVFPFLDDAIFPPVNNNWSDVTQDDASMIFTNPVSKFIETAAQAMGYVATDMMNIANIGSGESAAVGTVMEMAKIFRYSLDGAEVKVQFTLFNTVIKNNSRSIWKKHFKFLYLFSVRNMAWKITPSSFLPPLLYDVIIPGQKRLPLAYVKSVNVQAKGIIRKLKMENFIDSAATMMDVNVPEAWVVTITFKSLIGDNANLMISGIKDLKITTN